jgi:hypothetical protein
VPVSGRAQHLQILEQKITLVAEAEPWRDRAGAGEKLEIDLDFLVSNGRR